MDSRRHDLDALRGFAMLLGIALHASLAYVGSEWPVVDSKNSPLLGKLVAFVHGFRMPLFFVLSGFFTAMLWQKRGSRGLLRHRAKRILLPLALGCLTIVPAVWALVILTSEGNATYGVPESNQNLWTAAALGDLEQVRRFVEVGWPLNEPDPFFRQTPLGWAVNHGHPKVVSRLVDSGADANAKYGSDGLDTSLHAAAFFGRADSARLLLDGGADANARNGRGDTPLDTLAHGEGAVAFVSQLLGVEVDFKDVEVGRNEVRRLLADAGGGQALDGSRRESTSDESNSTATESIGARTRAILVGLMYVPFFHHLWFLWLLCWLVLLFVAVAALLATSRVRLRLPWWSVASPAALVWLLPLTALTHSAMFSGRVIPGFGPDTSAGILPIPSVLLHYAIFFGFGALVYATPKAGERLGIGWQVLLALALVTYPLALSISTMSPFGYELAGDEVTRRALSALGQSLFCWLMVFGTAGLCHRLLSAERPRLRYLSDSSYWLYLAHLPLVIVGQMVLAPLPLPALAKFSLLLAGATGVLLASYEWGVRYTFVGTLLNGKRTRPAP